MHATGSWTAGLGELSYRREGDPARPSVVLIHAVGTSTHLWDGVIPILAAEVDVVAIDLLGHGASSDPRRDLTIPEHADAVAGLVEHLGIDPVTLTGCSLGALIALDVAARRPGLVSSLVLNGCPGWHLESQRTERLISIAERLGPSGRPGPDFGLAGTARPPSAEVAARRMEDLQRCGRWFLSSWWAMAAFDPVPRLEHIRCPTHLAMGESDFHLATSSTLTEGISDVRLSVIPGAGHLTPFDDARAIARLVLDSVR
ncbi:alpha/beta hydrolase [Sporichthya brevicatena]|uniref:alpha/beta fold hydrolase n=1 Tax=Sporichthya brevicatena TaxID=171442 RepID=UPI0031DAC7D4